MSGRRFCPDREALIDELEQQRATGGANLPFEIGPVINTAKERGLNNLPILASQLQAAFARSEYSKSTK